MGGSRKLRKTHEYPAKTHENVRMKRKQAYLRMGGSTLPENTRKPDFSSFWHDLGVGGSFFLFKIQFEKVFKIDFFQLLARSWFWRGLFSIQNSI